MAAQRQRVAREHEAGLNVLVVRDEPVRVAHDRQHGFFLRERRLEGGARDHLFAFARVLGQRQAIVAVPRLVVALKPDGDAPVGAIWRDTRIAAPEEAPRCYRQVFTGACATVIEEDGRRWIRAADVFEHFPIGFLETA